MPRAGADVAVAPGLGSAPPRHARHAAAVRLLRLDVAGQGCALPVEAVVEVHAAVRLAPLPGAPDVVVGLVNRRARAVPVVSLRRRLGLPVRSLQAEDHLVVLELGDRELAVLVDAAVDVVDVPATTVDEAVGRTSHAVLSQGVAVLPDGLLVVLDATAFLSPGESTALDDALERALATATATA